MWGLQPASSVSVNRYAMLSTIIHPPIFFWGGEGGCMMVQSIACQLNETGDAGSSPLVARGFFNDAP